MKVTKYRIYPTKAQVSALNQQLEGHREVYNTARADKEAQYAATGKSDSCFAQIKAVIPPLRASNEKVAQCSYSALQQTVRRLHKAYDAFFKGLRKRPRFKLDFTTIEYGKLGDGWKVKNGGLYVLNIGIIYINKFNPSEYSNLVLKKDGDRWFACLVEKKSTGHVCEHPKNTVAIDFGIKTFITTSDGQKIDAPRRLKDASKNLDKINRQIKRAKSCGDMKRLKKKMKARRKVHAKVANRRKDFLHKLSHKMVRDNGLIVIEDLDLRTWISNIKASNAKFYDTGIGVFINYLQYKAESAGIVLRKVAPHYTSQRCHCCGELQVLGLEDRVYSCECGYEEDRDINAARNILALGLESFSKTAQ